MTTKEQFDVAYYTVSVCILIATVYYIATGPKNAVSTGRKLNNEEQKDNAKRELFLMLFSLRGNPVHYDFVRGLNQIDIVFEDTPSVLSAWHTHFDSLGIKGLVDQDTVWNMQRTNLLSAMALSLGYNQIRQTDMLQNYTPVGHENRQKMEWEFREAELSFYKSSTAMAYRIMERMDIQDDEKPDSPELSPS